MSYATLNSERVTVGSVCIPYYGLWSADVSLAGEVDVTGAVTLVVGNLTLQGFVYRGALFAGTRSLRLVGGAGGWRRDVQRQAYYNPNGVRLSLLLGDAASVVGERVRVPSDRVVGNWWVRETAPASRLVRQLIGETWWVDSAGVLQASDRTDFTPIASEFTTTSRRGGEGAFDIATEDLASWTPGRTFSSPTVTSPQKVNSVTIHMPSDGALRLSVLTTNG